MSKHKITVIDKEKITGKINENEVVNEILKKEFFNWMSKNGYGHNEIKEIFDGKRISSNDQNRFNSVIKLAKKEVKISITEIIIFLEENYVKFKKILSIFDSEIKYELKKELSKNFHIKLDENNLSEILE